MKSYTDVVIIGAGVMGCSAAFHLARLGVRATVVEKGAIASGMTKRSSAVIWSHHTLEAEARLALASLSYFQNWSERVGGDCGYIQTGWAQLVRGETEAAGLVHRAEKLNALGVNTDLLSRDALAALMPFAKLDDVTSAVYEPEAGYADPTATTQAFAARAKALGTCFETGTFVKQVLVERGRVTGVDTTSGSIQALTVIVTAGPWASRLLEPLGVAPDSMAERDEVLFFERPAELRKDLVACRDSVNGMYYRPHAFGLLLAGLDAPERRTKVDPDQLDEALGAESKDRLQERLAARLPGMANARYIRGHAGVYDTTRDGHAILDRVPGIHGLIVAIGFGDAGLALAPAVGACLAELVTDGSITLVDTSPFRLARFASLP